MAVTPIVRYMILCENCAPGTANPNRLDVFGILSSIESLDEPPYPLVYRELCVVLLLTEGRGEGNVHISCVWEETGDVVFESPLRRLRFGADPLEVVPCAFRIRNCPFPRSGFYSVEFWYNNEKLDERPLRLR